MGGVGRCVVLLLCEDACQKERSSSHLPQHINQCRPRHETWASGPILYYYVKSSEGCAALDVIWLDVEEMMYSPEHIRLYYSPSSTTHPSQPLHTALKSPTLPEINAALKLLVANLYKKYCPLFILCNIYHKFLCRLRPESTK